VAQAVLVEELVEQGVRFVSLPGRKGRPNPPDDRRNELLRVGDGPRALERAFGVRKRFSMSAAGAEDLRA